MFHNFFPSHAILAVGARMQRRDLVVINRMCAYAVQVYDRISEIPEGQVVRDTLLHGRKIFHNLGED